MTDQQEAAWPFLPRLPQIYSISSESQASLASGRPAGTAGPAHELLSALAQMALWCYSSDTTTDVEDQEGKGRKKTAELINVHMRREEERKDVAGLNLTLKTRKVF